MFTVQRLSAVINGKSFYNTQESLFLALTPFHKPCLPNSILGADLMLSLSLEGKHPTYQKVGLDLESLRWGFVQREGVIVKLRGHFLCGVVVLGVSA